MSLKGHWCPTLDPFGVDGGAFAHDLSGQDIPLAMIPGDTEFLPEGGAGGRSCLNFSGPTYNKFLPTGIDPSGLTAFTFSAWVWRAPEEVVNQSVASAWASGSEAVLFRNTPSEFAFFLFTTSTEKVSTSRLTDSTWHHVVGRWDGTTQSLWIDGVSVASKSTSGSIGTSTETIRIGGGQWASTPPWEGYIDDVQIYDHAISDDQIALLYQGGFGRGWQPAEYAPRFGEVGSWSASINDTGAAGIAVDNVGGNHGVFSSSPAPTVVEDTQNRGLRAWDFSGTNDVITVPSRSDYTVGETGKLSVAFWFYKESGNQYPMAKYDTASVRDWRVTASSGGNAGINIWNQTGTEVFRINGDTSWASGSWHHTVFTFDDATREGKLYRNGVDATLSVNDFGGSPGSSSAAMTIGMSSSTADVFSGLIDGVRIFNRVLLPEEIADIYAEGRISGRDQSYNALMGFGTRAAPVYLGAAYQMQDDEATTKVEDYGPHRRDGTLTGGINSSDLSGVGPKAWLPKAFQPTGVDGQSIDVPDAVLNPSGTNTVLNFMLPVYEFQATGFVVGSDFSSDRRWYSLINSSGSLLHTFKTHIGNRNVDATPRSFAGPDWTHVGSQGNAEDSSVRNFIEAIEDGSDTWTNQNAPTSVTLMNTANGLSPFNGGFGPVTIFQEAIDYLLVEDHKYGPEYMCRDILPSFSSAPESGTPADIALGQWGLEPRLGVIGPSNGSGNYQCEWYVADDASGTNEALVAFTTLPDTYTPSVADEGKYLRCALRVRNGGAGFPAGYDSAEIESTEWAEVQPGGPVVDEFADHMLMVF